MNYPATSTAIVVSPRLYSVMWDNPEPMIKTLDGFKFYSSISLPLGKLKAC